METINRTLAPLKLIDSINDGRIFFVEFTKKDGSIRRMTCRKGVSKGVNGNGMSYRPLGKGLLTIFDMDKQEYRMINLLELTKFTVNKKKYLVI